MLKPNQAAVARGLDHKSDGEEALKATASITTSGARPRALAAARPDA
jgi:hypothetical protein